MAKQTLEQIALKRALAAIERARRKSNSFENGDFASHEIMNVLRDELRREFAPLTTKEAGEP